MNTIKSIRLDSETYGINKGKLSGEIKFENEYGEIKITVDPAKAADIIRILAPALVATAQGTARMMLDQIEHQAALQAPIEAKAIAEVAA